LFRLGLDLWAKLSQNARINPIEAWKVSHADASLGSTPMKRYQAKLSA